MWRKVPCEQHLDMGESILRHWGSLLGILSFQKKKIIYIIIFYFLYLYFFFLLTTCRKGIGLIFPNHAVDIKTKKSNLLFIYKFFFLFKINKNWIKFWWQHKWTLRTSAGTLGRVLFSSWQLIFLLFFFFFLNFIIL